MPKIESSSLIDNETIIIPSNLSIALASVAESVNWLSDINSHWITIEQQLARWHIERKIAEANKNWDFYWTEPMTFQAHIVDLYALKDTEQKVDTLHWNDRNPDKASSDVNRLYSHKKHLIPADVNEMMLEIQRLKQKRTTDREIDLELISYLKLAKQEEIQTWLTNEQETLLDNIWGEIDTIVSWLREDLMIPLQEELAA